MTQNIKDREVYILLTDTGTLFTRTIKYFTHAPYNHVSLVFDKNLDEIYSFGRKQPRNPLFAGFVKENVYTGTYRYFKNTRCLLLKINVTEHELANIRILIDFFEANKELFSYNLIGLLGVLFNYPIGRKHSYFCSQFVAEVLKRSGIQLWNFSSALVTPHHFANHPAFEIIYEGFLYDYPLLDKELLENPLVKQNLFLERSLTLLKK